MFTFNLFSVNDYFISVNNVYYVSPSSGKTVIIIIIIIIYKQTNTQINKMLNIICI